MKTHYKKRFRYRRDDVIIYASEHANVNARRIQTSSELRARSADHADARTGDLRLYGRQSRARRGPNILNAYNDYRVSRDYGRSWKDFTRHRKQWMVSGDPGPSIDNWDKTNMGIWGSKHPPRRSYTPYEDVFGNP